MNKSFITYIFFNETRKPSFSAKISKIDILKFITRTRMVQKLIFEDKRKNAFSLDYLPGVLSVQKNTKGGCWIVIGEIFLPKGFPKGHVIQKVNNHRFWTN